MTEPTESWRLLIQRVLGEGIPDQVKFFARAARDTEESREIGLRPDVVAGHSLGEYAAAYAAGCFDLETGIRLVADRDHLLAEAARKNPGGMMAIIKADPGEVEKATEKSEGSVVANYNSPRQTVISGLRDALEGAASRIKGRAVSLNVSFAAHSPYVAAAAERMQEILDSAEFRNPDVPFVSAVDGSVLYRAEEVREALKRQMAAPVRWVSVVESLRSMRVEEWVELGGGNALTRMLKDFEIPLKGVSFEEMRGRLREQAQNLLPGSDEQNCSS